MSRRAALWVAFLVVHVVVSSLGFLLPNEPMGDVYRVYEPWSTAALNGDGIVGITQSWVYPQLALVPMVLAHAFAWIDGYTVGWAIFVLLIDAVAFALLIGTGRSAGRRVAGWFWLTFIALLGPVALYRLDAVTVALAIAGCLWLVGRPWLASMLLAIAVWIKVWPAAILAAAVVAVRRRGAIVGGALVVSALTLLAVAAAGGASHAFGFISDQTTRGLQVESPIALPYLWGTMFGLDGFSVYYSTDLLTFQVTGTNIDLVIDAMTPILVVGVGAVAVWGAVKAWNGAHFASLFPVLSLSLVTAFIVFNKVGSPQYMYWLVPSVVIGLVLRRDTWWKPASLVLGIALLTQIVYPLTYYGMLAALPIPVLVLTARNILLIGLFVWTLFRLQRVPAPGRTRAVPPAVTVS